MNSPKISVIVPVYNTEKYLHICIESILSQTFTDFELLLINDGSKDSSGKICDEYAARDCRVRVFHKENGGVGLARNLGLDKSRAIWSVFVDADDYIKSNYLCDLYNDAVKHNADFVIHDFDFIKEDGTPIRRDFASKSNVYKRCDYVSFIKEQTFEKRGNPVARLFNMDIIRTHNISYPRGVRFGEDFCFNFRYLKYTTCICCSANANYCYVDHPGSAIHRKSDFSTEFNGYKCNKTAVDAFAQSCDFTESLPDSLQSWVAHFMHRAITVAENKAHLLSISGEDWKFFNENFEVITRKTAVDKWMIAHFYKHPSILLRYLKFNVFIRETIVKLNMYGLLNLLKK